jgi:segregation and condensation protein B
MTSQEPPTRDHESQEARRGALGGEQTHLIETLLYVAGKPLKLAQLGAITGLRSAPVQKLANSLLERYARRNGALEIVELDGARYVLQLKPQYVPRVRRLSLRPPLTKGPLKTLTYIAYHQPVAQSVIVSARGSHAYRHVRILEKMRLVTTVKMGRTKIVKVTDHFLDYFNLNRNPRLLKRQIRALVESEGGQGSTDVDLQG